MARQARTRSSTGIYHIMIRGINQGNIFKDEKDKEKFLSTLIKIKEATLIKLYGYCLMDNHLHLLIKKGQEDIGTTIKRLGGSYVYWFNNKYNRKGHLFQDRFKRQVVENDVYLLSVLRYIHQNPIKAKIVKRLQDYPWSSYSSYLNISKSHEIDKDEILSYFGNKSVKNQINEYKRYMNEKNEDSYLEEGASFKMTDEELREKIKVILNGIKLEELSREKRNEIITEIKGIKGTSIRQISIVTGISRNVIAVV